MKHDNDIIIRGCLGLDCPNSRSLINSELKGDYVQPCYTLSSSPCRVLTREQAAREEFGIGADALDAVIVKKAGKPLKQLEFEF